ncbi:MAG: glutamate-5-semialdehyde dehydrogenase [Pseudomonadota bacterium]
MTANTDINEIMLTVGARAQAAAAQLARASADEKNAALRAAAERIEKNARHICEINEDDVAAAGSAGKPAAFIDRMTLDKKGVEGICTALNAIADQDDPVGRVISSWTRPNGLEISRVATPIGVVAIIYESRPNVTVDAGAIAVKAGNAAILRGGSECIATNRILHQCLSDGLGDAGLPEDAVQFVDTSDRAAVGALLSGLDGAVDLVIPRGGKSLVARVQDEARVAVLSHLDGICHVYLDRDADIEKAVAIALNAKMRRPGVCGAAETLLIDRAALAALAPPVLGALREAGCEIRGDEAVAAVASVDKPATVEDWDTEYLDAVISVAAVDGVDGAIAHIAAHASGHTDAIVTENVETAEHFLASVSSAIVLHNASTQYADGGEFGLGAEIGIATGKLHARGPVGAAELTTYKNVVRGDGQVRP